jgi:hypothetical protein
MDIVEVFSQFRKDVFPEETFEVKVKDVIAEFETFYPDIVKIIQKDNTFFDEERIVFGHNLSGLENRDSIWKNLLSCMVACFFHGDIREKVGTLSSLIKNIWNSSGQKNDDITSILNDDKTEGRFKEILDFVLNSRLAKIFTKLVESIDLTEFDLNIESTDELIEMIKNPENPKIQSTIQKVQTMIKDKVRRGEIDQNVIIREIETIKAKVIDLFGNVFKDALGGRRAEVSSAVMVGNSPEARRARMVARLQRKLREKNSK